MAGTPTYLPELHTQWLNQLNALRTSNDAARRNVEIWGQRVANDDSLQSQLDQARLAQIQAAQRYNSFIESGSELINVAQDAEQRLQSPSLSALERHQLETTRDNLYSLAGEFTSFKTHNNAQLLILGKVDIGPKTYHPDGRVEWNDTVGGLLGQAIEGIKGFASRAKDAFLQGPFTTEENHAICQSALGALLGDRAAKMLPAPRGGHTEVFWGEGVGKTLDINDPAGQMCRKVYPKGQSPRDLYLLGRAAGNIDPSSTMALVRGNEGRAMPSERQATHAQRFEDQLGHTLRQQGMSETQIRTLAAAAAKVGTQHGDQGEIGRFLLSRDSSTIALQQQLPPLREFSVAQALSQSPAEHWREAIAMNTAMQDAAFAFASPTPSPQARPEAAIARG